MNTRFEVPDSLAGERVDRAISLLTGLSRSQARALVEAKAVLLDGRPVAAARRLVGGEGMEVSGEVPAEPALVADPSIHVDVRHLDDDVIVVSKPAGLVMHPGAGQRAGTLAAALLGRFPELAGVGDPHRPGIVHRLDRDTSGLLVVARTQSAYQSLVEDLARHDVDRRYLTLVHGHPEVRKGEIDAPIGRSTKRFDRMAVREGGRASRTAYAVLEELFDPDVAFLECRLETGRTHQVRVHLAAIGHPVVGDPAYGTGRPAGFVPRLFLHASALGFTHPTTLERCLFEDPLPADLAEVLVSLKRRGDQTAELMSGLEGTAGDPMG